MNVQVGSYAGNSTDNRAITGVGFAPDVVIIKGDTTQRACFKTNGLAGDNTLVFNSSTSFSGGIKTFDSDGFTVGTDARANSSGVTYYWVAFKKASANLNTGTYSGNATDNRNITGVGFQPDVVVTRGDNTANGAFRDDLEAGTSAHVFVDAMDDDNSIQALAADGFQLGDGGNTNGSGVPYYWMAFKKVSGVFATGSYTGNATDNRSITGVGFRPDAVLIKIATTSSSAARNAVMYTTSMGSDSAAFLSSASSNRSNMVQGVEADGFQIGTDDHINASGLAYHYLAWKADSPATTTSTSSSTSTTSTSTSTTSTSSSTTSTSTSTTSTSTSTSTTSTSTTSTSSSTTSTSTTTTLPFVFSVEEI